MDRERWTSFPATTVEERALLHSLDGRRADRELRVARRGGADRRVGAAVSIEVAEPFDGKADVVVRLTWEGRGPANGEAPADDLWEFLDRFLAHAVDEARRRAAPAGRPGDAR